MMDPDVIRRACALATMLSEPPRQMYLPPWDYLRIKHGKPMEQLYDRLVRRLKYPGGRKARAAKLRLEFRRRP